MVYLAEEGLRTEGRCFDHAWQVKHTNTKFLTKIIYAKYYEIYCRKCWIMLRHELMSRSMRELSLKRSIGTQLRYITKRNTKFRGYSVNWSELLPNLGTWETYHPPLNGARIYLFFWFVIMHEVIAYSYFFIWTTLKS